MSEDRTERKKGGQKKKRADLAATALVGEGDVDELVQAPWPQQRRIYYVRPAL